MNDLNIFSDSHDFDGYCIWQVPALQETMDLLCLPPDRIGHGTCLHPEASGRQEFVDTVINHKTPLGRSTVSQITKTENSENFTI